MECVGIIPARYASTRFPGKPLAEIDGKIMIRRVYEQCLLSELGQVVVATDDQRIADAVHSFGGNVVMTSPDHVSGTDRCGEAARQLSLGEDDIVINIQGDEPFIHPDEVNLLIRRCTWPEVGIATLASKITDKKERQDPNVVKVVFTVNEKAIYFSRSSIPFLRNQEENSDIDFYKHKGIYAFRNKILQEVIQLAPSSLEMSEKLEQLRWIENGYDIHLSFCQHDSISIDTPEDLEKANLFLRNKS